MSFIKDNYKKILSLGILFLITLTLIIIYQPRSIMKTVFNRDNSMALSYDVSDFIYLSDIDYIEDKTYVEPGYYLRKDKNNNSGLITLNIKDEETNEVSKKPFIKGISAWASSNIVYDLQNYDYDYFTAYLGVDASQVNTYYNSGVSFTIYTSNDGENWKEKFKTNTLKGWDNAVFAKVDIKNVRYLKLYAYENGDSWYSQWYDDAVYANAKLIKEDYVESFSKSNIVKELSYYDDLLKKYDNGNIDSNIDYDLLLLQREFINNVGYDILQSFINYSQGYENLLKWLLNDKEVLELYVLGGTPDGNYGTSLQILNNLYTTYADDLKDPTYSKLYLKMMVTLSLTHSQSVGLWVSGAPENPDDPNGSNAIKRYAIYKELHSKGLLDNQIFENLSVEEMRFVMNNIIDDEEIVWLNNLSRSENSRDPYHYIIYTFDYNYSKEEYYNILNKDKWNKKIRNDKNSKFKTPYNFLDYGITYGSSSHPKLWIVFEEGSVCGGLSKTGSNINGSFGIPSTVVSQPGHAAYIYMALDKNNNKVWNLYNDVSGWGQSGKTEKLSTRMPNGWGTGSYVNGYPASYILLSQSALNDYDNYVASEKILMKASIYKNDLEKQKELYEMALSVQNINFDAWLGLVNLLVNNNSTTQKEYLELVSRITTDLKYYPLPMLNLIELIEPKLTVANNIKYQDLLGDALHQAKEATDEVVLQSSATRQVANYLLNSHDITIATFSFDGEDAGKIKLADRYEGNGVRWQYSVDGGEKWHDVNGMSVKLSQDELNVINEETDILVRIVGDLETIYDIQITTSILPPTVYNNDLENRIIGITDIMEWRTKDSNKWTLFKDEEPNLKGDKDIYVRVMANGTNLASEEVLFHFTKDGEDRQSRYIPLSRIEVTDYSSDEKGQNNGIEKLLDGNINTHWHTIWNNTDKELFVTLKLEREAYISKIDYVPRISSSNGNILKAKISFSLDGENFIHEEITPKWNNNNLAKSIEFSEPIYAKYIKIEGLETVGGYMSATAFHIYEDLTLLALPEVDIVYDNTLFTNKDVTAKLVLVENDKNIIDELTITNSTNIDSYSHVFTENGEHVFEYIDKNGNTGSITAKVDWIDKTLPTAKIKYSTTKKTDKDVTATLVGASKEIKILNNNGKDTYTFTQNGTFTFEYEDKYGNKNTTKAVVNWINKTPANVNLTYNHKEKTTNPVTVTLTSDEDIIILNNNGKNTYTFTKNGTFVFLYQDSTGNVNRVTAEVTWIVNEDIKPNNNNNNNNSQIDKEKEEIQNNKQDEKENNNTENNKDVNGNNSNKEAKNNISGIEIALWISGSAVVIIGIIGLIVKFRKK